MTDTEFEELLQSFTNPAQDFLIFARKENFLTEESIFHLTTMHRTNPGLKMNLVCAFSICLNALENDPTFERREHTRLQHLAAAASSGVAPSQL